MRESAFMVTVIIFHIPVSIRGALICAFPSCTLNLFFIFCYFAVILFGDSAVFFGGWLKQGRFGTKEFLIKKPNRLMFLGTPSFLPKNNLDHGAERRQSRPFASFVQAFLVVG